MDAAKVPPKPAQPPDPPGQTPAAARARGRAPVRPALLVGGLAVALGVVLALALTGTGGGHPDRGDRLPARTTYGFQAAAAGTVVLDGVSGNVQVSADPAAHSVTGSFHRPDGRPAALYGTTADDPAPGGGRTLTLRCADEDSDGDGNSDGYSDGGQRPCAGDLVLTLPAHTGLRLRQTSGTAVLDGLGGDLSLDGSSLQLTATDLRSPRAELTVVSGSADLGFAAAPADLGLHAASASVAVHLPRTSDGYAVSTAAASANVQVLVPRDPSAAHRIALTVTSGSLSVQNT